MSSQLIYADINANSSGGGGGYDDEWFPPDPPDLPGYNPYDEDGEWTGDDGPVIDEDYLYGSSGRPICSSNSILAVGLEWHFTMFYQNLFPRAFVNGKEVCERHSPGHIVMFKIDKTSGSVIVKMSLKSSGKDCYWDGGASCIYSATYMGTTLRKNGTCSSGASFRVSIKDGGEVSIS